MHRRRAVRTLLAALTATLLVPAASSAYTISADPQLEDDELVFTVEPDLLEGGMTTFDPKPGTATEGSDFDGAQFTQNLTAGMENEVRVPVIDDALAEGDETVVLMVVGDGAEGTGTILDDEPRLSIGDGSFAESDTAAKLTIIAPAAPEQATTIPLSTNGGADVSIPASVELPAGATSVAVPLTIANDTEDEADESFTVTLGATPNAAITDGEAALTITNDDLRIVDVQDTSTLEGTGGNSVLRFAVGLSAPTFRTVTVNFMTGDGSARAPGDYLGRLGQVTFAPGQTSAFVDVAVVGDSVAEESEALGLGLTSTNGTARLGDNIGIGVILDDDSATPPGTATGTAPGQTTEPDGDVTPPRMTLSSPKAKGRRITIKITCPRGEKRCTGRVSVYTVPQRRAKVRSLRTERRVGAKSFRLTGGRSATIRLTLPASLARAARRAKRLRLQAFAVTEDDAANVDTRTRAATVRIRR